MKADSTDFAPPLLAPFNPIGAATRDVVLYIDKSASVTVLYEEIHSRMLMVHKLTDSLAVSSVDNGDECVAALSQVVAFVLGEASDMMNHLYPTLLAVEAGRAALANRPRSAVERGREQLAADAELRAAADASFYGDEADDNTDEDDDDETSGLVGNVLDFAFFKNKLRPEE